MSQPDIAAARKSVRAMNRIWHYFHDLNSNEMASAILGALVQEGISTYPLDPKMPEGSGIVFFAEVTDTLCDLLREVSRNGMERVVAVSIPGYPTGSGQWKLLEAGAADVVTWADGGPAVIAERYQRWHKIEQLLDSPVVSENLVGAGNAWRSVLRQIIELARFTDAPILLTGESGTGKELAARLIHTLDQRPGKRNLVVLDCTTVMPTLSGSEFFGHERGAFTGAAAGRDGAFALADGGTLFLDEVGELPPELQAQLLRVVQEKSFKRVGGNNWQKADFRLICATNKNLQSEVKGGRFRSDLYYRISACICSLPPLRERRVDVIPLARHFMKEMAPGPRTLEKAVEEYLIRRDYPGNVRDLRQLIMRIMYRHVGDGPVTVGDIPEDERPRADTTQFTWSGEAFEASIRGALQLGVGLKEIGRTAEETAVRIAVHEENYNLQRAAKRLGVTDRALQLRRAARQNEYERQQPVT